MFSWLLLYRPREKCVVHSQRQFKVIFIIWFICESIVEHAVFRFLFAVHRCAMRRFRRLEHNKDRELLESANGYSTINSSSFCLGRHPSSCGIAKFMMGMVEKQMAAMPT